MADERAVDYHGDAALIPLFRYLRRIAGAEGAVIVDLPSLMISRALTAAMSTRRQ